MDNSSLQGVIGRYESFNFSVLPTIIYRLDNLSDKLGKNLYCKRDDLTGFAFGGNKTRKLDYLMKDAIDHGADCIVTFGSNQSNWCRMAAAAASYLGLEMFLLLDGPEPGRPSANLILNNLVNARIEYLDCQDHDEIISRAQLKVSQLENSGRKPYFLPVGGSTAIGTLGYINAFREILDYSSEKGIVFDTIFLATGSAGTQAGLVCAKIIEGWKGNIIGVSVGREKVAQELMVKDLVRETLNMCKFSFDEDQLGKAVFVDDDYYGEGYRINTGEAGEAIKMFAQYEGIFLDEVYTGKAASALIDYARKGILRDNQEVLFIHSGGSVQLFE
jgi:D-cysteine desulfhydrase/L-cysteate sulfo-lyase